MAFSVPGQVLQKVQVVLGAGVANGIATTAYATTFTAANLKKANAVLISNGNVGTDCRLAIDGATATALAGANPGIDLFAEKLVYTPGLPGISLFSSVGGTAEVFLLSVNSFGR